MSDVEKRIQELGKEVMQKAQELHKLRLELPPTEVEDYVFEGPDGAEVRLSGLFGDRKDLVLIHNMGSSCPYCTLWADSFNGLLPYFVDRAAFAVVSPDEPEVQRNFAETRGWKFPMFSDRERRFTKEMGFWGSYGEGAGGDGPWPGFSTFRLKPTARVRSRNGRAALRGSLADCCEEWWISLLSKAMGD